MTTNMKQLPAGNSNFGDVITGNYAYVDKTRFIELLENEFNKKQFFIRPRKFGKSLFYSMLDHYYDVNKAKDFEKLFGNLYICKNPTPKHNSYLMMSFDFSGINTGSAKGFEASFSKNVQEAVVFFLSLYREFLPDADNLIKRINDNNHGIGSVQMAFNATALAKRKIFVLIDEYDHFANDLIAAGTNLSTEIYHNMVEANGIVRDFYETLKTGTKTVLDRIFITGVSPVMLNDLTSGFNIADNLSLEEQYNEMMGFTQAEVDALMIETGIDPAVINVDMELYYNGYLFNEYGENRMYNPAMIIYFFKQVLKEKRPPKYIIDENLRTDYGRLRRLVANERNSEQLMQIVKDNGIVSEIVRQFSIDNMYDDKYFVSLLVYMGMLTIDKLEEGGLRLKIPNYTIRTLYWEYIGRLTADMNNNIIVNTGEQTAAIRELAYRGNPTPYIDYVSQRIFSRLSNRDLRDFDEKYIKIMLLNGLFQSLLYVPLTEREVEGGYMDIYLQRSPLLPDVKYEWVWEIKYLKKNDETPEALQAKRDEANVQLQKYRRSQLFAERNDLKFASIIFIGKDRYEINEPD